VIYHLHAIEEKNISPFIFEEKRTQQTKKQATPSSSIQDIGKEIHDSPSKRYQNKILSINTLPNAWLKGPLSIHEILRYERNTGQ